MLGTPRYLSLDVRSLERTRSFYESTLGLSVERRASQDGELAVDAGDAELRLRPPGPVPRGGGHTHYALSIEPAAYDEYDDRLSTSHDVVEREFGGERSLYCEDPDGHCVELAEDSAVQSDIGGLFEVVLEVEALDSAVEFYDRLGFEIVDRGHERRRVRVTTGSVDLELWEPQLGIAGGRGGVHVDWGIESTDPKETAETVSESALSITHETNATRIRDPDGHYLSLVPVASR